MEERISEGKDRETGPDRHRDMGTAVLALMGPVGTATFSFDGASAPPKHCHRGFGPSGTLERFRPRRHKSEGLRS